MNATKILIGILVAGSVGIGGYFVWENYFKQGEMPINTQISIESEIGSEREEKVLTQDDRDNQRVADILAISKALESYAMDHSGKYPETNGLEEISNNENPSFIALKNNDYLKKLYVDPLPDKYYYGYKSDGSAYELSAILENKDNGECTIKGNLCVYRFKKGEVKEEREEKIKKNEDLVKDILPVELLPKLSKYGFETKETSEMTQSEWLNLYKNIGEGFGINVPKEELYTPMLSAFGEYKRKDETLSIRIYKFENEENTKKWFDLEVNRLEELQALLKNSKKLTLDLKETEVQNCESYYSVYGYGSEKAAYESSIFWSNGIYYFELKLWRDNPWPQDEAIQIAEEISMS